jgi:2-keto-4-pentenoate hydratase/2-oxohepta-3-ene-1,7-dioic acid hydratase in catechol pathway
MKIVSVHTSKGEIAALKIEGTLISFSEVNRICHTLWPEDTSALIKQHWPALTAWYHSLSPVQKDHLLQHAVTFREPEYAPLFRDPGKIWGIGLNYARHAGELEEKAPQEYPASFMKPLNTLIGYGDTIRIPALSQRTTGEAELGIVIGERARNIKEEEWLSYVAGFVAVIDMTAEDILRKNPRYLTLVKSFDTFFSLGPELITPGCIRNLDQLEVQTVCNGKVIASNTISNMTFSPGALVAFHSRVMPLEPGDIISSGTPGAVPLKKQDTVECRIKGFIPLKNVVEDEKFK